MSDYMTDMFANSDGMINDLHAEREAGLRHMYHIFEFLFAANVLSGMYGWWRSRRQSPEALAQQIASEYGL
jgi:hypothetical protein